MKLIIQSAAMAALIGLFAFSAGTAEAKCNAECKANKAYYGKIWESRKNVEYQGERYQVAVVPDRKSALISWEKKRKTISLAQIEGAASKATGCIAKDTSVLSFLGGSPDTQMPTKAFRKLKYIKVSLKC